MATSLLTTDSHHVTHQERTQWYWVTKGWVDRAVALLLLIPGLPMIGVLVLIIKANSRGPGIYSQQRVGKNGRIYTMYKLRSMRSDAETSTGPVWSPPGSDPRVTWLGYWLRKLHLDELPQLFNVLKGEMSLIGPRPERPEFVAMLSKAIPDYRQRLQITPGVTGLAQINLPPDTELDDVRRKLVLDREYIEKAGLLLDVRILLCTFLRLCGLRGEMAMHAMRLHRTVELPAARPRLAESTNALPLVAPREVRESAVEVLAAPCVAGPCEGSIAATVMS